MYIALEKGFLGEWQKAVGKWGEVIEEKQLKGLNKVIWTPENLNKGIYYFRLEVGETVVGGEIIMMK